MPLRNIIIIGSGPAGLTAAIYAARANLLPLIIQGLEPGGQLTLATLVENYPGFADGINGSALMGEMRKQAERFGAEIVPDSVVRVSLASSPFKVSTDKQEYDARSLIIASGASAALLGLESEKKLLGRGVSICATCDAAFFKNKNVIVVGGGDSAMEDALFLTRFASQVTVIHRRDKLRASKILQERAFSNKKIDFAWNSVVDDIFDAEKGRVTGVRIRNVKTGALTDTLCNGVFVAIGHKPNTEIFRGQLDMDEKGYIKTSGGTATSVPGVFAAGDVQDPKYRQAITAAGLGCMAALDAQRYLESTDLKKG